MYGSIGFCSTLLLVCGMPDLSTCSLCCRQEMKEFGDSDGPRLNLGPAVW